MKAIIIGALCCLPFPLLANDNHALAINLSLGNTTSSVNSIDGETGQLGLDASYRYHFTQKWGAELGYKANTSDPVSIVFDNILKNPYVDDVKTMRLVGYFSQPLSQRNRLVVKVGPQRYNAELRQRISKNSDKISPKKGWGVYAAVGWQYQFDSGFEINLLYDYSHMGDLNLKTYNLGFGYRF